MRLPIKRPAAASAALLMIVSLAAPALMLGEAYAVPASPSQGLEISPPLLELNANPGQTVTAQVKLRNITKNTLLATSATDDFVAQGETGQPKLLLAPGENSPYSMKNWIAAVPDLRIAPGQQVATNVTIQAPKNASPGGHYAVLRFTATPEGAAANSVALSASIGTLILLNVSGHTVESASVASFYASRGGKQGSFFEHGPLGFTERIQNSGNVHVKPSGDVLVKNIFGHQTAVLAVNNPAHNILPSSIRRFDQLLPKKNLFGPYSAKLTLIYGSKNQTLQKTIHFWVIPYKLIIIILLGLLILFLLLRFGLKTYKRRIISQARRGGE